MCILWQLSWLAPLISQFSISLNASFSVSLFSSFHNLTQPIFQQLNCPFLFFFICVFLDNLFRLFFVSLFFVFSSTFSYIRICKKLHFIDSFIARPRHSNPLIYHFLLVSVRLCVARHQTALTCGTHTPVDRVLLAKKKYSFQLRVVLT